jgi:Holin of 3TMs, for gene-transfer release
MPKLDEEDFVDPGNLPQVTTSRTAGQSAPTSYGPGSTYGAGSYSGGSFGPGAGSVVQPDRNAAGANAAQSADVLVAHDKESSDWINKKWRPVMGWVYMMTCTMDFVVFPILWSLLQAIQGGQVSSQWNPITLQGAGLYHIAMGAVLGIAAYGRTKEKLEQKQ